jgi:hypothetical protein
LPSKPLSPNSDTSEIQREIERCIIATFRFAESMGFKRAFRQTGGSAADWRLRTAARCFVTAEQCRSERFLKERRKRTGKLVRLFLFGKPDFPAKNLTATRNYGVVGDIPTQNGSELLPAIARASCLLLRRLAFFGDEIGPDISGSRFDHWDARSTYYKGSSYPVQNTLIGGRIREFWMRE